MAPKQEDDMEEKNSSALDKDGIALLRANGLGPYAMPYAMPIKEVEKEIKDMAKRVNDLCGAVELNGMAHIYVHFFPCIYRQEWDAHGGNGNPRPTACSFDFYAARFFLLVCQHLTYGGYVFNSHLSCQLLVSVV
ncbi:hypothetical protein GOP47_0004835 [Adiantum capillus-veneris]|uniref:Uncharacterized protein n=1 Tax=Adiantum capillus-veneris TaxID=13818 RepID=A0A9D4V4S5_ADICA|nr:hypothetical protein GOP47_0004835 [Adiantum capillus-veneris]